jgi:putative ABC transport system permease protein
MFKNFFKIALRNFRKQKGFTFINILGLTVGLTTCILIFLYVQDELSYDRHFEHADRIFRLERLATSPDGEFHWAATTGNIIPEVTRRYPQIEAGAKVLPARRATVFHLDDKHFNEEGLIYADSSFFRIFSFKWIYGDAETALKGPEKLVLTQSASERYFGKEDPVGKTLKTDNNSFVVSGVVEDVPVNTHFHFDMVVSMDFMRTVWPQVDDYGPSTFYSYVLLNDEKSLASIQQSLETEVYDIYGYDTSEDSSNVPEDLTLTLLFNNTQDVHLGGNGEKEWEANNELSYIYIFGIIAMFVLLIASFNYMNLSTARSLDRAREVGIRKVLGAVRPQLFWQFMAESVLVAFIALGLAVLATYLLLPMFNGVVGKALALDLGQNMPLLLALISIGLGIGFLSGAYPALFMSGFKPIAVLKSSFTGGRGRGSANQLRKALVVLQFFISVGLITAALTVSRQLSFIQDKTLGFNKEQVVVVPLSGGAVFQELELLESKLEQEPEIVASTPSSCIPGRRVHIMPVRIPGLVSIGGEEEDSGVRGPRIISVDEEVEETFGLEIIKGRGLSKDFGTDAQSGFLINEAAVEAWGLEDPVGKPFEYIYQLDTPKTGTIVGIVKNFHYASLHTEVEPLMMHVWSDHYAYLNVRVSTSDITGCLEKMHNIWTEVNPTTPFNYFFLDDNYDQMYKTEMSTNKIVTYFTLLAIFIACLGLFGLAAFTAQQRTREIGIRKVLGASVGNIIFLLTRNFALLVLIASALAIPLAWWLLSQWLEDFAYRIDLGVGLFLGAGFGALLLAVLTVGLQSLKAAMANPVDALKDE